MKVTLAALALAALISVCVGPLAMGNPEAGPTGGRSIHLSTIPEVPREGDSYRVTVGMKIQIRAEVEFAHGQRREVSKDPRTLFVSTDEQIATVTQTGEVSFLSTGGWPKGSVGIIVGYGEIGDVLNFVVLPAEKSK